jgi:hypothetical protein
MTQKELDSRQQHAGMTKQMGFPLTQVGVKYSNGGR